MPVGEIHEHLPVVRRKVMLACSQMVRNAPLLERFFGWRKSVRHKSLFPVEPPCGRCQHTTVVFAFLTGPHVLRGGGYAHETGRKKCDELMLIHLPVLLGVDLLNIIPAEPIRKVAHDLDHMFRIRQVYMVELRSGTS